MKPLAKNSTENTLRKYQSHDTPDGERMLLCFFVFVYIYLFEENYLFVNKNYGIS